MLFVVDFVCGNRDKSSDARSRRMTKQEKGKDKRRWPHERKPRASPGKVIARHGRISELTIKKSRTSTCGISSRKIRSGERVSPPRYWASISITQKIESPTKPSSC